MMNAALLCLSSLLLQAAPASPGVQVWKASDLTARGQALAGRLNEQKSATDTLATTGNRTFLLAHREGSGVAEWHEKQADVTIIVSGEVTMVYGGTIADAKPTSSGEIRGPSIKDGTEVKLGPGDILHIPAKTPHQMLLAPGQQVTYFVAKVIE